MGGGGFASRRLPIQKPSHLKGLLGFSLPPFSSCEVIRGLIETNDGTHYFVERFWGNSQRYDLGDAYPLVGASAPDFEFGDGTRLGTRLESGRALLIDFSKSCAQAEERRC